jgi:2-methylisocitrate lyase-like PEP mutase family enzyme
MTRENLPNGPHAGPGAFPTAPEKFRALHASGCFIIPNPWDRGSAVYLHHIGFKALATTSAGFAFSRGLPDSVSALSVDNVLEHVREIVAATPLPVNADFQSGYAGDADGVAENVAKCVRAGAAGLSIEDATGNPSSPLFTREKAVERIRAARASIDGTGIPVVLTARCEAWLVGDADPFRTSLDRLVAYADAGADCLFAPGVREPGMISAIVKAVAPKPVNVIVSSPAPGLSLERLEDLGVRRISVGSALARVAWTAFMRAAGRIQETGTFDALEGAATFTFLNELFTGR